MKRIVSFLLALCLLGILPAAAANNPAITYHNDGNHVELTLEGVEEHIMAVELELVLEGNCPDASFAAASDCFDHPVCRTVAENNRTTVTIYLVSGRLLSGSNLPLGTLTPGGAYRLPAQVQVKLLDRSLRVLELPGIEQTSLSGTGGSSGGSSSDSGSGNSSGSGSSSGSSGSTTRKVQISSSAYGSVTAKPSSAAAGTTVTLTAAPDSGYVLESIRVTDSRGRDVELTESGPNQRTFKMPAYAVEINAVFAPKKDGDPDADAFVMPFADIAEGAWCFNEVRYVYEHGLMNGTSAATFTPNATTTRGMIVAILYRMEGSPDAGTAAFSDVSASAYYASAVAWASENGVVNGYGDGTFRPNNPITREQMAAFLYRYAALKGQDVSQRADLSAFADAPQIASYAVEAIQWANARGLVNGTSAAALSPKGNATRAQAAVILTRYAQTF